MDAMIHFSLFSGIGGFDLASEWMGWNNYLSCELADFPNKVLKHYWPKAYHHRDIKTLDYDTIQDELTRRFGEWRTEPIILTGGFPCQPYSLAGQRKGKEDERHLWPEMLRLIHEIKPDFIVGENVFGLLNWNGGMVFHEVLTDLGSAGYDVTPLVIPAAAVNAPHGRDRVWFVAKYAANPDGNGQHGSNCEYEKQPSQRGEHAQRDLEQVGRYVTNAEGLRRKNALEDGELERGRPRQRNKPPTWDAFPLESPICGGNDGLPTELDRITFSKWRAESIKAYGNAIVPQVAYQIFKTIDFLDQNK